MTQRRSLFQSIAPPAIPKTGCVNLFAAQAPVGTGCVQGVYALCTWFLTVLGC